MVTQTPPMFSIVEELLVSLEALAVSVPESVCALVDWDVAVEVSVAVVSESSESQAASPSATKRERSAHQHRFWHFI